MLIHLYQCRSCGHDFEKMRSLDETPGTEKCPRCGSDKTDNTATIAASCSGPANLRVPGRRCHS